MSFSLDPYHRQGTISATFVDWPIKESVFVYVLSSSSALDFLQSAKGLFGCKSG